MKTVKPVEMSAAVERFPLPTEIHLPREAEGWEELYPYFGFFSEARRDNERFWVLDNLHFPVPMTPFEADILIQYHPASIGTYQGRVWALPAAVGPYYRVLGGYIYISSAAIQDPKEVERRTEIFRRRAGNYFSRWEELLKKWRTKMSTLIEEVKSIKFEDLPEYEHEETVTQALGYTANFKLVEQFDKLMLLWEKSWYYHFEMFNAYGAALAFMDLCKKLFPGISDKTIFSMISGITSPLWEPDERLRNLAKLAVKLGLTSELKRRGAPEELFKHLSTTENGKKWLQEFEASKDPWFYVGTSQHPGIYNPTRFPSWIHDLSVPLNFIVGYIDRLEKGENIDRPLDAIASERDRITQEYTELLKDPQEKKAFKEGLGLARMAWPYTEEHNWWADNLTWTITWTKTLELGEILAKNRFIEEPGDIFYMKVEEVRVALHDLGMAWGEMLPPFGPTYWPKLIEKRKKIVKALEEWKPPRALGKPPEIIVEPITIMLWGITTDRVKTWLKGMGRAEEVVEIRGLPGSPGRAEGSARIIRNVGEIKDLRTGEIIVSPFTSPMWAPAFGVAKAVVTDIGGLMSHCAIVCREYGIPAVVGTGMATSVINTGDIVRVDGGEGVVKIVTKAGRS